MPRTRAFPSSYVYASWLDFKPTRRLALAVLGGAALSGPTAIFAEHDGRYAVSLRIGEDEQRTEIAVRAFPRRRPRRRRR